MWRSLHTYTMLKLSNARDCIKLSGIFSIYIVWWIVFAKQEDGLLFQRPMFLPHISTLSNFPGNSWGSLLMNHLPIINILSSADNLIIFTWGWGPHIFIDNLIRWSDDDEGWSGVFDQDRRVHPPPGSVLLTGQQVHFINDTPHMVFLFRNTQTNKFTNTQTNTNSFSFDRRHLSGVHLNDSNTETKICLQIHLRIQIQLHTQIPSFL